jgi:hypothetical protein
MIILDRKEFLVMCVKKRVTLEQAAPSIVSMNNNMWTCDELHPAFPSTITTASADKQMVVLMGSMESVDIFQNYFIAMQEDKN